MHLNKPDTLNSLTVVMAGEFEAALQQLQADKAARALVITGRLLVFTAHRTHARGPARMVPEGQQ